MNHKPPSLVVLDVDISFKDGADMERVKIAAALVEKMYAGQKSKTRGGQSKDALLVYLALGLADELLQMKTKQAHIERRIEALLAKIEKSV